MFRFLRPGLLLTASGFPLFLSFVLYSSWFLSEPSLAQSAPSAADLNSQFDAIWGQPDDFITSFKVNVEKNLNQYVGSGVAISGFIIVLRVIFK